MGKYKYRLGSGLAFSEEKDIKMCETFASKGYKLVSVNSFGFYKFERSQPEEVSFAVDYIDKYLKNEELAEYIQIFESGGWNHVCSLGGLHYFKAERDTVSIYTDDITKLHKLEILYKSSVQSTLIGIVITVVCFVFPIILPLYPNFYQQILITTFRGGGVGFSITMGASIITTSRRIAKHKKRSSLS